MYLTIIYIVDLPAVTVGTGVVVAIEETRELVGICDIVVVNLPAVTREVIGVYDSVVIPTG